MSGAIFDSFSFSSFSEDGEIRFTWNAQLGPSRDVYLCVSGCHLLLLFVVFQFSPAQVKLKTLLASDAMK